MASEAAAIRDGREWAAAFDVQQRFMQHPAPPLNKVDYSGLCREMQEIGGDCYDFFPLPGDRLGLAVADASGKGLPAALMISNVQSSLRMAAVFSGEDGAGMVAAVNRHVFATSLADRYATLFYGVVDQKARTLRYVNAGHNPPLIIRRDGSVEALETGGAPVGMFPDWTYQEGGAQLNSGDLVLAYTDGVIEAENAGGEMWGAEGLASVAIANRRRSAAGIVRAIFRSMDEFSDARQRDDETVVVVRVL